MKLPLAFVALTLLVVMIVSQTCSAENGLEVEGASRDA